jgi:gliding motility-associated-like protein
MRKCLLIYFLLKTLISFSQLENNNWYFGNNAGLNFSTTPPTPITGSLSALEGTASISNSSGSALFYTNGVTVWNANHSVMLNGNGILGGSSSTQPALIVPIPQSCKRYYLFTTEDHLGSQTFRYSIVDMCLDGGLGGIDPAHKNIILANNMSEKLTSVMHSNGTDVWIITHEMSSNIFKVFLVNANGIQAPINNAVGFVYNSSNFIGPVKASVSGTKIAAATTFTPTSCQLFNFNPANGSMQFSQNISLNGNAIGVYGLEFSPNENFLYISTIWGNNILYQYNISTGSTVQLGNVNGNYSFGALQLGLDNKIYLARNNQNFISVINNPNNIGTACNYVSNGLTLAAGSNSTSGFPNFSAYSFFEQPQNNILDDTLVSICPQNPYLVDITLDCNSTILWNTGSTSPTQAFSIPGIYSVSIQNSCNTISDTITIISNGGTNFLPNDTVICDLLNNPLTIIPVNYNSATTSFLSWNTGSTSPTLNITNYGTYIASFSTICGVVNDTILISDFAHPIISGPSNISICDNSNATLTFQIQNSDAIIWNTGENTNSILINAAGNYTITASNTCYIDSATTIVGLIQSPVLNPISNIDTCISINQSISVSAFGSFCDSITWSTGTHSNIESISNSGTYSVIASNNCGTDSIQFDISISFFPELNLPDVIDTCFEATGFEYTIPGSAANYEWSNGQIGNTVQINNDGLIYCSITNNCGTTIDSILINRISNINWESPLDSISFCKDGINAYNFSTIINAGDLQMVFENLQGITFTGENQITETGWYIANVINNCNTISDTIFVEFTKLESELYIPNTFTPNGDGDNDILYHKGYGINVLEITIYNRWGECIFKETNGWKGWDGKFNELECPDGGYQVIIIYEDCTAYRQEFIGHVNLLR